MSRRSFFASLIVLGLAAVAPAKQNTTKITVRVRDHNNEPVDRAAVIVKRMRGKHVKTSYELRTSQEGTAPLPPLPQGTFLIQVIAKGYQTYGEKFTVTEPEKTIDIRLSPPQAQFSVDKPAGK
ncbi:MAG TPA: carboxypeptidase-like regulatory domain-containing protein [Bryobacterales bacterium]|nr:carboxypeptidase-like regulatory domain-containing protein [Bryobacterales bacterium]